VTVKSRVISPEFRGRMVSFGHGFLNLLFAGMKLPVLFYCCTILLIFCKRRLQLMLVLISVAWTFGIYWFISFLVVFPCYVL